ncbi:MAG: glutathione peroxidase, partial [Flavobacteriales bacterium]|nr:glutathione peroxidase [Flavobacteriales bacterium]
MCSILSCSTTTTDAQESIYDIKINSITGEKIDLSEFKGKKILFVNVASECGFTKQYTGLEELHQLYKD